ncbi:MAG: M48 family metalloprotease [Terriglobia bacterium]
MHAVRDKKSFAVHFSTRTLFIWLALITSAASLSARQYPVIRGTPDNALATHVLDQLLATPLGRVAPKVHYRVILVNTVYANALSNASGEIYVASGMFRVLLDQKGMWASVIGHELGHVILDHPDCWPAVEAELQKQYDRSRRAAGKQWKDPDLPEMHLGKGVSKITFDRQGETQADFLALMLMAEAGYQPGFALVLDRRMSFGLGDAPQLVAAFSDHPRWKTREQDVHQAYNLAWAVFSHYWPDEEKSPGGHLPPYGTFGRIAVDPEGSFGTLVFRVPFHVQHAEGMRVRVAVVFVIGGKRLGANNAKDRAPDGSFVANSFMSGAKDESSQVTLRVPANALAKSSNNKLEAIFFLMSNQYTLDIFKMHVEFPKS